MATPIPSTSPIKSELSTASSFFNIGKNEAIGNVLPRIETWLFNLGIAISIIFIILAAYKYFFGEESSSKGNTEAAQKALTYAAVSLAITLMLRVIFVIIAKIFGFSFDPSIITK
jgi:hypothetical protein